MLPPRGARPGSPPCATCSPQASPPTAPPTRESLAGALARLAVLARRPSLVAIVSDFRDQHGLAAAAGAVCARHSVLAVEVHDPRESALPAVGRLALVDPESGERVDVDTSSPRLRARFEALERERREELAATLRRLRVAHVPLDTAGDWPVELARGLGGRTARERR